MNGVCVDIVNRALSEESVGISGEYHLGHWAALLCQDVLVFSR
jgi:hypothetical protein